MVVHSYRVVVIHTLIRTKTMHIYSCLLKELLEPDVLFTKALIVSPCIVVWAPKQCIHLSVWLKATKLVALSIPHQGQVQNLQLHGCIIGVGTY